MRYHEHAILHFSFAGHIGEGHRHECGIPQGCPLSMMAIAFMLKPWHHIMDQHEVTPRALADDLLITTDHQQQPLLRFQLAFDRTCEFLQDMGAKISAHKSKLYSTHGPFREWLQSRRWAHIHTNVPVVANFRDLGSSVSLTLQVSTSVSRERLVKAIHTTKKISWLPHQMRTKATFLRASAIAQGLYACEASAVDEVMLRKLTTQIVALLQPSTYQASKAVVFTLAGV
eukprot:5372126-Karenia_brevis.AAC.1